MSDILGLEKKVKEVSTKYGNPKPTIQKTHGGMNQKRLW